MARFYYVLSRITGCLAVALLGITAFVAPDRAARADYGDECAGMCAKFYGTPDYTNCMSSCCYTKCGSDEECAQACKKAKPKCPETPPSQACNFQCTLKLGLITNTCIGATVNDPGTCLGGACSACTCSTWKDPNTQIENCYCQ